MSEVGEGEKQGVTPKLRFPEFRDGQGWRQDTLGNSAFFVSERLPLKKLTLDSYVSTENILPYYEGVTTANKLPSSGSATRFKSTDTLMANIRPYLKKVWLADKDGGASNDVIVFRPKNGIEYQFLASLLKNDAFIEFAMRGAKGVKMPRGDTSLMKEYPLALPPRAEQQKIGDCLASIDNLITAQSQKLEHLQAHKKGLMQQLFPAEGETVPKLRFPEFQGGLDWEEDTLVKIAKFRRGSFPQPYGLPEWYDEENGTPFIQVFDVDDNLHLKARTKNKISELGAKQSVFIPQGTLIVTLQGSIGRVAITQYDAYIDRTLLTSNAS